MTANPDSKAVKLSPEKRLTELLKREVGVDIHPTAMRIFLRSNWRSVSAYAHAVHDGKHEVEAV
jgi:transposase